MNDQRLICSDVQRVTLDNVDNDWLLREALRRINKTKETVGKKCSVGKGVKWS